MFILTNGFNLALSHLRRGPHPSLPSLKGTRARTHARGHTRTHSLLLTRTLKKMVNHSYFALIYIPTVPLKLSPHNIQHLLHQSADVIQFIMRVIEALDC